MNFAEQQADPTRRAVGFGAVLLFHALLIYALVTGLAKKVVDVVRAPIETKVIEEIKKPPPPPEVVLPPPPKMEAPPPPYIPPPEIVVANPPPAPAITVAPSPVPPAPAPFVPTPPVVAAPVAAPAPPTPVQIGVACPRQVKPEIPRKAYKDGQGVEGFVKARITVRGGQVVGVDIIDSRPKGLYDASVKSAVSQYSCAKTEGDVVTTQEFNFSFKE